MVMDSGDWIILIAAIIVDSAFATAVYVIETGDNNARETIEQLSCYDLNEYIADKKNEYKYGEHRYDRLCDWWKHINAKLKVDVHTLMIELETSVHGVKNQWNSITL